MDAAQAQILIDDLQDVELDGWRIKGFLGKGKSAVVLPATRGAQEAAIKVFHPELVERYGKSTQLERILREKSLVGASHPNLVRILDGGECPTTHYLFIVMERLNFKNLHEVLSSVPESAYRLLISQIASAARFLEDRNLAHRDIKPENIAVSEDYGRAVLLDLGVVRPIGDSNLTDVDQRSFIGTLRYSSPEFLERKEEDTLDGWRAITFYQLGAVLHDLLMRRVLFEADTEPFAMLVEAVKRKIPEIHANDAKCVELAKHCLIKNPATRLELVNWSRFQVLATDEKDTATPTRDRIKQRQKYFLATSVEEKPGNEYNRNIRRILDDASNRLESRIAVLMNDLQTFPLRSTNSFKDVDARTCSTYVHFERDEAKGLPHALKILVRLALVDENQRNPLFKLDAAALFSEVITATSDKFQPITHLDSGELQTLLDGASLETVFLRALDDAYEQLDKGNAPTSTEPVRLAVTGDEP